MGIGAPAYTTLYVAQVEGACSIVIHKSLKDVAEARQTCINVVGASTDMSVKYSKMESDVMAFQMAMNLQSDQLKKHAGSEQTFKQHAVVEYNKLEAITTGDIAALKDQHEKDHAQLKYVSHAESSLMALLQASEARVARLQQAGNEQLQAFSEQQT